VPATWGGRRGRGGLNGYPAGAVPPMTVADLSDGGGRRERDPLGPVPLVAVADLADCGRGERHPLGAGPLVAVDDLPQLGRLRRLAHTSTIVRAARILARILEVGAAERLSPGLTLQPDLWSVWRGSSKGSTVRRELWSF